MKKLLSLFLCLILVGSLIPCAMASSPKIVDDADLLTSSEERRLEEKAQQIADEYQMDVVILTVWSIGNQSAQDYVEDYFDYNGYGIGSDYSGVIFLLSMEYRDWAISTCGDAAYALTDYGIELLFESCKDYLSDDEYYDGFDVYLDQLSGFFEAYEDGKPIDGYHDSDVDDYIIYDPDDSDGKLKYDRKPSTGQIIRMVLIGLVAGLLVATVALVIMRAGMNTFRQQRNASSYLSDNRFQITHQRDVFLYSHVSRTPRNTDSGSSRRGGGGSSMHRSSSGRSHGGRSGKF